jgi:biopolymer transport protein ExbB
MNLQAKFLDFALLGAQWVLWLLVGLSVASIAIMIERLLFFARRKADAQRMAVDLRRDLAAGDLQAALARVAGSESMEAQVAAAGLRAAGRSAAAAAEAMQGERAHQRHLLERNLAFLGTLGNNAPFIGLFGTVLGIIKAFHDLSKNSQAAAESVMGGVSEALVATAIGLLVAIPAVMVFNYFNRRVRASVAGADTVAHVILAELRGGEKPEAA